MRTMYAIRDCRGGYFDGVTDQSKGFSSAELYNTEEECRAIFNSTPEKFCLIDKIYIP